MEVKLEEIQKILNQPAEKYFPAGIKFCWACGVPSSHSLIYCKFCGKKFTNVKDAKIIKLLMAENGAYIHNSITEVIYRVKELKGHEAWCDIFEKVFEVHRLNLKLRKE